MNDVECRVTGSMSRRARGLVILLGSLGFVSVARAETYTGPEPTTDFGVAYATQCQARGVPLPPDLNSPKWKKNGTFLKGTSIEGGAADSNFGNGTTGTIFYSASTSPAGLCVAYVNFGNDSGFTPNESSVGFVNVICQASTGKACFWQWVREQLFTFDVNNPTYFCNTPHNTKNGIWRENDGQPCTDRLQGVPNPGQNPRIASTNPADFTTNCNVGPNAGTGIGCVQLFTPVGSVLGSAPNPMCTSCHTGENVFINPYLNGGPTDLYDAINPNFRKIPRSDWFPASWPDPIVPQTINDVAVPQNTWPSGLAGAFGDTSGGGCLGCHNGATAGRFPELSEANNGQAVGLQGFCDILQNITNKPGSQGGMPPSSTCDPKLNNCPLQTDEFVQGLVNAWCWNAQPVNPPTTPDWQYMNRTLRNAYGTLAVNGADIYGMDPFVGQNPYGNVTRFDTSSLSWQPTNGLLGEISIDSQSFLYGTNINGTYVFHPPTIVPWLSQSNTAFSHLAQGDAFAIDGFGQNVFMGLNQLVGSSPWVSPPLPNTDTIVGIAAGKDFDAWLVDALGNAIHNRGGVPLGPGQYGWSMNDPFFSGAVVPVNHISESNQYNVWASSSSVAGLFNYNPSTNSWQRHCPTSGSCPTFSTVSVSNSDDSVWALTSAGAIFRVDQSKVVNQSSPTSTDSSLVSVPGTLSQIAAGGGLANGIANAVGINSSGQSWRYSWDTGAVPGMTGGAYWFVDLGDFYHVQAVKVFGRSDCCGSGLSKFRVLYYNGSAWVLASDQSNTVGPAGLGAAVSIDVNFNSEYVMVQKVNPGTGQDADTLGLAEVEVMGQASPVQQY
jgi:hypothetical protein